jgi:hypothetical protein
MARIGDGAATPGTLAVEIHDLDDRNVLAFDLPELLDALGARASTLDWVVADYDPVTEDSEVQAFADSVYDAQTESPRSGVRVTSAQLRAVSEKALQTVDGQFIGVPSDTESSIADIVDLRRFPTTDATLLLKAVDSSFWIVISKSSDDIAAIRQRFRDVREADRTLELGYRLDP